MFAVWGSQVIPQMEEKARQLSYVPEVKGLYSPQKAITSNKIGREGYRHSKKREKQGCASLSPDHFMSKGILETIEDLVEVDDEI